VIKYKTDKIKKEFYFDIHPRLRGLVMALDCHLTANAKTLDSPQLCIVCARRTKEENFRIYGRHRPSAHCTRPCRAVDIAINTQGHPNYISDKAAAAIEEFITNWFPRYDGYKAFIRHGEPKKADHMHLSVQP